MKVLVVTVVHTPFDARIHHRQIRTLRDAGVEVTQVAPWSAYRIGATDGVPGVVHVDVPRASGRRRLRALRRARRRILELGPGHDLVLLHDPELVLAVAGRLGRLPPVVLDVHEDLAASLHDRAWLPRWLRGLAVRAVGVLERWAERRLASLLLAEEGYRSRFRGPHPVVPNLPWRSGTPGVAALGVADLGDTGRAADDATARRDRVVYVGRLSTGRGARELLAIGAQLHAADGPRLELIGAADADVEASVRRAHDRGEVVWHGFLPNDEAMVLVRGSVAGLAPLHDLPNYRVSMPTKVVEYLANGVPPIVTPLPESARLVEAAGSGVVVPFGDVEETVRTVLDLAADPERRTRWAAAGRAYIAANHSWDTAAPRFVEHLRATAGQAGPRARPLRARDG